MAIVIDVIPVIFLKRSGHPVRPKTTGIDCHGWQVIMRNQIGGKSFRRGSAASGNNRYFNPYMDDQTDHDSPAHSSAGMGILAFVSAFPGAWLMLEGMTKSSGLSLVFSVFIALFAFDYGRRSILATLTVFLASMLLLIAQGIFHLVY